MRHSVNLLNFCFLLFLGSFLFAFDNNNCEVVTLAGSTGVSGNNDGTGKTALFNCPRGIAVDSVGNVYVADSCNKLIRKITFGGVVTTVAGSGFPGSTNGTKIAVAFHNPSGIAVDSAGNIYVADTANDLIQKITPVGQVITLAGSTGVAGTANGIGSNALFNGPVGVAVDSLGNVYVSDSFNNLIRKITPGGVVSTLAGGGGPGPMGRGSENGVGTSAAFWGPIGITVDSLGNVYVADRLNHLIRKINPGGVVTTLAGSGFPGSNNGAGATASFFLPMGVTVDSSQNVYVADTSNNLIRKITPGGIVTTLAGSGSKGSLNGKGISASFRYPAGVAVDSSGNVYVADLGNNLIRKIH